jgi:hypothetical protein
LLKRCQMTMLGPVAIGFRCGCVARTEYLYSAHLVSPRLRLCPGKTTMFVTIFRKAALALLVFAGLVIAANRGYHSVSDVIPPNLLSRQSSGNLTRSCSLDQSKPPGNLTFCGNSTLFGVWRPKARFIAPEGWMNDPQGGSLGGIFMLAN